MNIRFKSNHQFVNQFNNLLISCLIQGCFTILTQKRKRFQKKKKHHAQNTLQNIKFKKIKIKILCFEDQDLLHVQSKF